MRHYSNLVKSLSDAGVNFTSCGEASQHKGRQITIRIYDEQASDEITLYFNIDIDGQETFVCQE